MEESRDILGKGWKRGDCLHNGPGGLDGGGQGTSWAGRERKAREAQWMGSQDKGALWVS